MEKKVIAKERTSLFKDLAKSQHASAACEIIFLDYFVTVFRKVRLSLGLQLFLS